MLRFVITAGGTEENIDGVRKITNFSTGNLGWLILEALLGKMESLGRTDFHVYYIHGNHAVKRNLSSQAAPHIRFLSVTDAESALETVCETLKNNTIDVFIHSMAVSDFTFSYSANIEDLSREIFEKISAAENPSTADIEAVLKNPETKLSVKEKISSSDDLLLALKPTKKIIPHIKQISPKTYLIGFKLLRNVSGRELMLAARKLARDNGCDAVLANDLSHISQNRHEAILLKNDEITGTAATKKEIAEMIVNHCIENLNNEGA